MKVLRISAAVALLVASGFAINSIISFSENAFAFGAMGFPRGHNTTQVTNSDSQSSGVDLPNLNKTSSSVQSERVDFKEPT